MSDVYNVFIEVRNRRTSFVVYKDNKRLGIVSSIKEGNKIIAILKEFDRYKK